MNIILFKQTQIEELTSTQQQVTSELSTILMQTDIETVTATSSNTKLYKLYESLVSMKQTLQYYMIVSMFLFHLRATKRIRQKTREFLCDRHLS